MKLGEPSLSLVVKPITSFLNTLQVLAKLTKICSKIKEKVTVYCVKYVKEMLSKYVLLIERTASQSLKLSFIHRSD